jgi:chromatin remodeling complex protein RSC6
MAAVAPAVAPAVEQATDPESLDMDALITRVSDRADAFRRELALIIGDLKVLRRAAKRVDKTRKRRPVSDDPNRKLSGFARPSELSDELCAFLGVERSTQMARTNVTRLVCKYIKDNNLNSEGNRRSIDFTKPAAAALKQLLQPESGAVVTYFNLQRYLKPHIVSVPATTTTTESVAKTESVVPTPTPTPTPTPDEAAPRKRAKRAE